MADYSIGDKVNNVNSNEKGTIVKLFPPQRGRQLYSVVYDSGKCVDELECNLAPVSDLTDPFERCKLKIYGSYHDFSRANTIFKIQNSNNNTISSLKASKTIFKPYQFIPLLKFVNSENNRLLVADEVGLGKTIEAGHIMLELKARNEFRNALIVCPKSLQEKWREELYEKFGLSFSIYDDINYLNDALIRRDGPIRAIVNYEKIRKKRKSSLVEVVEENNIEFSLMVFDEAHRMRNEDTMTYDGAQTLLNFAKAAVFLTATPIMISPLNLYNLLHLLNPVRYKDKSIFEQNRQRNVPFIKALHDIRLKEVKLEDIADDLENMTITANVTINEEAHVKEYNIGEFFAEMPIYRRIIANLRSGKDNTALRVQIQSDLAAMSPMNAIFTRTRKRDVVTDWSQSERIPHQVVVPLSEYEQLLYNQTIEEYIRMHSDDGVEIWAEARLGLVSVRRQLASSVFAYCNDERLLDKGEDVFRDYEDEKVNNLCGIIEGLAKIGLNKIIVFAIFTKTLKYLNVRLSEKGFQCAVIHGKKQREERELEIDRFRRDSSVKVLLSSEVGSEGLDLQFCSAMLNYDLPWNPMVVEQRIGRIDRFGQKSPVVNIYNMIVAGTIQEIIYDRLLSRIGLFRNSIGDLEAILDSPYANNITISEAIDSLENDFYMSKLPSAAYAKRVDEIASAIIRQKEDIKQLEDGLTNTMTNDSYFQDEINRILRRNAYVTDKELSVLVKTLQGKALPSCSVEEVGNDIYKFSVPKSQPHILLDFLNDNVPKIDQLSVSYGNLKRRLRDETDYLVTFNQDVAYDRRDILFVNMYHPIIAAAVNYYNKNETVSNNTFSFGIRKEDLSDAVCEDKYFLGLYVVSTTQDICGVVKNSSRLHPVLYNPGKMSVVTDETIVEEIMGAVQTDGVNLLDYSVNDVPIQTIDTMRIDMSEAISDYLKKSKQELSLRHENDREMRLKQVKENYSIRIESLEERIGYQQARLSYTIEEKEKKQIRAAVNLLKSNLEDLRDKMKQEIRSVEQIVEPVVSQRLVSLNLIKIV